MALTTVLVVFTALFDISQALLPNQSACVQAHPPETNSSCMHQMDMFSFLPVWCVSAAMRVLEKPLRFAFRFALERMSF